MTGEVSTSLEDWFMERDRKLTVPEVDRIADRATGIISRELQHMPAEQRPRVTAGIVRAVVTAIQEEAREA